MSEAALQHAPRKSASHPAPSFTANRRGLLQRKCACGGTPGPAGECEACRKKKLQRPFGDLTNQSSINQQPSSVSEVPSTGSEILRLPDGPLVNATSAKLGLGHDFSQISVNGEATFGGTEAKRLGVIGMIRPASQRRIHEAEESGMEELAVPMAGHDENEPVKVEAKADGCPVQTVEIGRARCRRKYGAVASLSYGSGAKKWWFKERVYQGGGGRLCQPGYIDQTSTPFRSRSGRLTDDILDTNGPPRKVAPCSETTYQTVFAGPTKEDVEKCQYQNIQVITITANEDGKSGKVTTSSAGKPAECDWS